MALSCWIRRCLGVGLIGASFSATSLIAAASQTAVSGAPANSGDAIREGPQRLPNWSGGVGEMLHDVTFTDVEGVTGTLTDCRGRKATIFCMTSLGCPLAKKLGPGILELEKEFRAKGVAFILVNPDAAEPTERVKQAFAALKQQGFAGRYVHDRSRELSRRLSASSSTEAFVVDGGLTLAYRGAIDDQFGLGYALPAAKSRYLSVAITAVLAGQSPDVAATTAPGCLLDLRDAAAAPPVQGVTFHNQIARLLRRRCQECHRLGENGPFSLLTFEEAKDHLGMIKKVVNKGTMPPWYADTKVGHWSNDRSLSEREKSELMAWIDGGAGGRSERVAAAAHFR